MKLICISNEGSYLPVGYLDSRYGLNYNSRFALIEGKEYIVYGITLFLGHLWYYLCDENYSYYPIWNPSPLFKVVDKSLSKYWQFNYFPPKSFESEHIIFGFPEWVNDLYFYDQLTDGKEEYKLLFAKYKKLMDLEFPDTKVKQIAKILEDKWIICPFCDFIWEEKSFSGLVECSKCHQISNNPFYNKKIDQK